MEPRTRVELTVSNRTLLRLLAVPRHGSLAALLAEAIETVTGEHRDSCDVTSPISPSATVAVLRVSGGVVEHLVLGDSFVVLDRVDGAPLVVTDPREVELSTACELALEATEAPSERERLLGVLRARRNQPRGFWVAKDDPRAASEAVTGSCPVSELIGAVLLSNGVSRYVNQLGLGDWAQLLTVLAETGPAEVIHRVRQAEAHQSVATDDATIAVCAHLGEA